VIRDANATRARILEAAAVEFAAHGLAGARVDRLAELAGANKQRIYANFGSKEGLFDATLEGKIGELLDTVPFDADDLPGYSERLFDFTLAHPELIRLVLWHSLERPGAVEPAGGPTARKVAMLGRAQQAGVVADYLPADRLVTLILGLVHASLLLGPRSDNPAEIAAQRAAVRSAVQRLVTPIDPRSQPRKGPPPADPAVAH
jgi:AcrR family transcriptional regulator